MTPTDSLKDFYNPALGVPWVNDSKMTTTEHLEKIKAKCQQLLAIAERRTVGKWSVNMDRNWETFSVEADDTICDLFYMSEETHHRHPFYEENEQNNANFIASCAGPAEAGYSGWHSV
jgi:hypothetical protein